MEKEKKVTNEQQEIMAASEYAFEPVPESAKKSAISLIAVLAGYLIAMSNFVAGAAIGNKMSFWDSVKALVASDIYLVAICLACGMIAFKLGATTTVIARKVFGQKGSMILSCVMALSVVCWLGTNGDTFAKMLVSAIPGWPLPVTITAVILIFVWLQSACRGYKGLEIVSFLGVPAAILLSVWVIVVVVTNPDNMTAVTTYVPQGDYSFAQATTAGVGSWIFGAISSMDVIRFAKKKSHFLIGGIVSFFGCLLALQLTGVICAQATGMSDFVSATVGLGIAVPSLICSFFALWTTQDNNIYSASMSIQNVFMETPLKGKVKHKYVAYGLAIMAALFSLTGALNYVLVFVSALSVLLAPMPGLYIAEIYIVKSNSERYAWNIWGLAAWVIAGITGYYCNLHSILIPPVVSGIVAFCVYVAVGKIFLKDRSVKTEVPG